MDQWRGTGQIQGFSNSQMASMMLEASPEESSQSLLLDNFVAPPNRVVVNQDSASRINASSLSSLTNNEEVLISHKEIHVTNVDESS